MNSSLKIKVLVNGIEKPLIDTQDIEIREFTYTANRMGDRFISGKIENFDNLDDVWFAQGTPYVTFRNEQFYMADTPSSEKKNTSQMYSHTVKFVPIGDVLKSVLFYDSVGSTDEFYHTDETDFVFYADLETFVNRINASLDYSGYTDFRVVLPDGTDYIDLGEDVFENKLFSFSDNTIYEALEQIFEIFEIQFRIEGHQIIIGEVPVSYNTETEAFKYGIDNEFLTINRTNQNSSIVTNVTAIGSTDNIPLYYPNLMDDRDQQKLTYDLDWILPKSNLYPPIYTKGEYRGKQKFYPALNNTYLKKDGLSYYEFTNEYNGESTRRFDYILTDDTIKPSITGMTNSLGERIDEVRAFTFKDISVPSNEENYVDSEDGTLKHSYFNMQINRTDGDFPINLFDSASARGEMTIAMTSGKCQGCEFKVMVDETKSHQITSLINLRNDSLYKDGYLKSGETPIPYEHKLISDEFYASDVSNVKYAFNLSLLEEPQNHQSEYFGVSKKLTVTIEEKYYYDEQVLIDNAPSTLVKKMGWKEYDKKEYDIVVESNDNPADLVKKFYKTINELRTVNQGTYRIVVDFVVKFSIEQNYNDVTFSSTFDFQDENIGLYSTNYDYASIDSSTKVTELILAKDVDTYDIIMPHKGTMVGSVMTEEFIPEPNDTFVILYIDLPQGYIDNAEDKLKHSALTYMEENNVEKYKYSATLSRVFTAQNNDNLLLSFSEYSRLWIEYNLKKYLLEISQVTWDYKTAYEYPELKITLSDDVEISNSTLDIIEKRLDDNSDTINNTVEVNTTRIKDYNKAINQVIDNIYSTTNDRTGSVDALYAKLNALFVGEDANNYSFVSGGGAIVNSNNTLYLHGGVLAHYSLYWGDGSSENNYSWDVKEIEDYVLTTDEFLFVYLKAKTDSSDTYGQATWFVSPDSKLYNEEDGYYYFLYGYIPKSDSQRILFTQFGKSNILGGKFTGQMLESPNYTATNGDEGMQIDLIQAVITARNGAVVRGNFEFLSGDSYISTNDMVDSTRQANLFENGGPSDDVDLADVVFLGNESVSGDGRADYLEANDISANVWSTSDEGFAVFSPLPYGDNLLMISRFKQVISLMGNGLYFTKAVQFKQIFEVENNADYTFSFFFKKGIFSSSGYSVEYFDWMSGFFLTVNYLDSFGNLISTEGKQYIMNEALTWEKYKESFVTPNNCSKIKLAIQVVYNSDVNVSMFGVDPFFALNSIKLEKGTKATRYTEYSTGDNFNYLSSAIKKGSTDIDGGLVATNLLCMKGIDNNVTTGLSGMDDNIAFWAGCDYNTALENVGGYKSIEDCYLEPATQEYVDYLNNNNNNGWVIAGQSLDNKTVKDVINTGREVCSGTVCTAVEWTTDQLVVIRTLTVAYFNSELNKCTSMIRKDGSGFFSKGELRWDVNGNSHMGDFSFRDGNIVYKDLEGEKLAISKDDIDINTGSTSQSIIHTLNYYDTDLSDITTNVVITDKSIEGSRLVDQPDGTYKQETTYTTNKFLKIWADAPVIMLDVTKGGNVQFSINTWLLSTDNNKVPLAYTQGTNTVEQRKLKLTYKITKGNKVWYNTTTELSEASSQFNFAYNKDFNLSLEEGSYMIERVYYTEFYMPTNTWKTWRVANNVTDDGLGIQMSFTEYGTHTTATEVPNIIKNVFAKNGLLIQPSISEKIRAIKGSPILIQNNLNTIEVSDTNIKIKSTLGSSKYVIINDGGIYIGSGDTSRIKISDAGVYIDGNVTINGVTQ